MRSRVARFMRAPLFRDRDARIVFYMMLAVSYVLVWGQAMVLWTPVTP